MKLMIDNENNIIFKIDHNIHLSNGMINERKLKRLLNKKINKLFNIPVNDKPSNLILFSNHLNEIEYFTGFEIEIRNNFIYIYGDNGVIEYEIIDLKNTEIL